MVGQGQVERCQTGRNLCMTMQGGDEQKEGERIANPSTGTELYRPKKSMLLHD